ncbi:MAG TPA: sigma-70 family RNA polymerase sigma factor [Polyangia bacterium]|nr:sigma-70 family RNA polymerase sigma factor [Polyangia bacterium]
METTDETHLVDAARRGDHAAYRTLVERHQRKAFAVAFGILRDADAARDACQDAFLKAHQSLASFEGTSQFYTWLYRVVVNLCLDQLRRRKLECVELDERRAIAGDVELIAPRLSSDPDATLAAKELRLRLEHVFARLSPAHRAVLTLREVNQLSYKEIADAVGCSIGTVMSRLFHARRNAQALLRQEPDFESLAA